ncbi:MAG: hypothetical protein KDI38_22450 [Calditrichaeota bacterium]|nr:hypothetical protein [Calditrichota bacterium]MCB9089165.1 hypothetical protein [Calditrichia bacterium]
MRLIVSILTLLLGFAGALLAQNEPAFPIGEQWQFPDARTLGMGGAGSVSNTSAAALLQNPAALAGNEAGLHLQLSPSGRKLEERRAFPIYDRFGSFLTDGIYAVNEHWFTQVQGGLQYNFETIPLLKSLALGAYSEYDQNYTYEEEVRENDFEREQAPFAYNKLNYDGSLTRYAFGAAFQPAASVHAGVQVGILNGELKDERSIIFVRNSDQNIRQENTRKLANTPLVAALGAIYQVNPYLALGSHLRLPYTVDYDVQPNSFGASEDEPYSESIEYPMLLNVGLEYRGQQAFQARLNVDVSYEWWSQVDVTRDNAVAADGFDDVVQIKAGIEHLFFEQVPFLVGIQYRTTYQDRRNTRLMFTGGSGFTGRFWRVDVAAGFSKVDYRASDLFADALFGGDRSANAIDDVTENYFFGMATLRVNIKP